MTYIPKPVTQRDGSSLANSNCLMAAAAVGLDYETLGKKTSTGAKMRSYSGDSSGGTNSDEIEQAWADGYNENPLTRDGQPFSKVVADLEAGRAVMLQVWHATTGKVCVSGSGAYGHGMTVLPKQRMNDGQREWYVADPWCNPPKWAWVRESKLKAGAEEWVKHSASGAIGTYGDRWPDPNSIPLGTLRESARKLMTRYNPGNPSPFLFAGGVAGPKSPGVLFVSTAAHKEGDVSINTNGSRLWSNRLIDCGEGLNVYSDAALTDMFHEFGADITLPYIGPALGPDSPGVAVLYETAKPYEDGQKRATIVYVNPEHVGDPYTNPTPMCPPDPVSERDAQWRAWLDGDAEAPDKADQMALDL